MYGDYLYFKGFGKMQCSSHLYRGVLPQVLVTSGTTAIIKMTESQIEWVCFKLKLSQRRKQFLRSHSERVVTQYEHFFGSQIILEMMMCTLLNAI